MGWGGGEGGGGGAGEGFWVQSKEAGLRSVLVEFWRLAHTVSLPLKGAIYLRVKRRLFSFFLINLF